MRARRSGTGEQEEREGGISGLIEVGDWDGEGESNAEL